jgi:hypothetical protein
MGRKEEGRGQTLPAWKGWDAKMIDFGRILKRSWHILWSYRMLWVFGLLLVLAGGGGASLNSSSNLRSSTGGMNFPSLPQGGVWKQLSDWFNQSIVPLYTYPEQHLGLLIGLGVGLFLLLLVIGVAAAFVRYVSEVALLRMVDGYEQGGSRLGFRDGWKLGWTRRAFRMWVIDLVISLPVIVLLLLAGGLGLLIGLSALGGNSAGATASLFALACGLLLFLIPFFLLVVFLSLLRLFMVRTAALEGTRISESFRTGWGLFRRHWKSAALMWLIMLAIGICYGIASLLLAILLIPVMILTGIAGLIVAAVPGLLALGIASLLTSVPLTWIIALLVALPFFVVILVSPLLLVSAWMQVYSSAVWTLTYREMKALEADIPAPTPPVPLV